jgi:patatin-like phospholipase/acyl hydrolase
MPDSETTQKQRFILSVDGGGIRGLIPAVMLKNLESQLQARGLTKPLCHYFDLMVGTSTGGIIVAGLSAPHFQDSTKPATNPDDLIALYEDHGAEIFDKGWTTKIRSFFTHSYGEKALEKLLKERLGPVSRLSEALTKVTLTAYDIERRRSVFMSNCKGAEETDFLFWQAARGTSAAPTFFKPALVTAFKDKQKTEQMALIDGGVFANDPVMAAYVEAIKLGWNDDKLCVLSLGTGQQNRVFPFEDAKGWGALDWISPSKGSPIISILMQGQASTAAYQAKQILMQSIPPLHHYLRLDGELKGDAQRKVPNDDLDDTRPDNLMALREMAERLIREKQDQIDIFLDLIQSHQASQ